MTPVLNIACACGRSQIVACPTVAQIGEAQQQFVGWTFDDRGRARCPECSARGEVKATPAREADLFASEPA